ncbi:MAG TPA: BON domain-containing protein, partial [Burkholderiaceae bacterium]|jgi:osmotically-inducible protein OsmY|nr:BON domain-containing protein [Burkholderiaceae bacterium]
MKTDEQLQREIHDELDWDPAVRVTDVGVSVKDGVVTLTGHVGTYAEKHAAERAAQRVAGVRAVAVELDVLLDPRHHRGDSEIAAAVEHALKWNSTLLADQIQVLVSNGHVTLRGMVDWAYQRDDAARIVRSLAGVTGIDNLVELRPAAPPPGLVARIREALQRQLDREADRLQISLEGDTVTLRGSVHSWAEFRTIQGAAWSAPGVNSVVNELKVEA